MYYRSERQTHDIGKAIAATCVYSELKKDLISYCKEENFNDVVIKRARGLIAPYNSAQSYEQLKTNVSEYKKIFESFGYGPEDTINYINDNPTSIEASNLTIFLNPSLLDYAGVLEETMLTGSHLLYRNSDPKELYSIIKWLKDSEDNKTLTVKEIEYYITHLSMEDKRELKLIYPFDRRVAALMRSRHLVLTEARMKANKAYTKGLK